MHARLAKDAHGWRGEAKMTGSDEGLRLWAGAGALIAAAVLSAVLIVLLRPLLRRHALVQPNARSSHREPTPQGGGIAVVAATIVVTVGCTGLLGEMRSAAVVEVLIVLAASALLAVVGGIDDLRPMPVAPRLMLQMLAIAVAVGAMPTDLRIVPLMPWWAERLCLVIALVWFVNLVNFMDGIDWMTVAEVVPLTASVVLLGQLAPIPPPSTILALALLGAMVGFAPFNKPVAKLFFGDVGSLPVGLLLGWLLLQLARGGEPAAALLLPLYYLADATVTLIRRIAAGEPFWQAHRSHFYQRACDLGFTVPAIVGRVFLTNVALAGLALLTAAVHDPIVMVASLLVGAALVAWLLASFARKRH
jgi:UDP-N-acetylmuramyl pentapeptide phosphotransferase/UDP-N-acetylglucosamine-1-phosphate transferase